jgi:hypothetical protein
VHVLPSPHDKSTPATGVVQGGRVPTDRPHVCIISYTLAAQLGPAAQAYGVVLCDESHNLKTVSSQRTTICKQWVAAQNLPCPHEPAPLPCVLA